MIHVKGAPKFWCVVPREEVDNFNALLKRLGAPCVDAIRHVDMWVDPEVVAKAGIRISTYMQTADSVLVLEPGVRKITVEHL